jgi:4-amino-4-deoxy-L-arabinose transferase-like glycosyltransferase
LFTTNPVLVTSFVMLLNSIGIVLLYFFLKKWFGKGVARIATLFAASAPWAILYSRKIWAQDCLFPFMILFYIIFFSNLEKYSRTKTYVIFFLLAIITQLHMSAWFLFLPIGAFYLITKEKIRLPDLVIGLCIAGLTYVPYALYHYSSHFANVNYFIENRMHTFLPPGNIVWSFIITCGFKFSYFLGESGFDKFFTGYSIGIPYLFFVLYLVLTLAGFGYGCLVVANLIKHLVVKKETVDPSNKIILLFLLIFIMTHACYLLFKINPLPHYSIIFYPILPVFTACFIEYGLKKIRIINKVAMGLVVLVLISNLYFITVFYNFIGREPQSINGNYGIPYLFVKSDVQKYLDPKVLGSLH